MEVIVLKNYHRSIRFFVFGPYILYAGYGFTGSCNFILNVKFKNGVM